MIHEKKSFKILAIILLIFIPWGISNLNDDVSAKYIDSSVVGYYQINTCDISFIETFIKNASNENIKYEFDNYSSMRCFGKVNGLDKDFFAHQEEIDLCWRLKNNGYKIMVVPDSTIYHVGGATLKASSPLKTYLNFRNNLYMLFKNLPKKDLIYVLPIRLVLDGVASMTFLSKEKGFIHFLSILKAHFSFYINIPKLIKKRKNIKQKGGVTNKYKKSILLEYYLKKKKKFSDIFN